MNEVSNALLARGFIKKARISHDHTSENKTCSKCKQDFPRTNEFFRKEAKGKDGLSYLCKACSSVVGKASRGKHADRYLAYTKSPEFVFSQLKHQAKKRNIVFTISFAHYLEHLSSSPCHFCGAKDTKHWVDRYINDHQIGYTEENTVPCCELCNKMKAHRHPDVFKAHCSAVHAHNNK